MNKTSKKMEKTKKTITPEKEEICIRCFGKIYGSYISAKYVNVCKKCEHFFDMDMNFRNKGYDSEMQKHPILRK